MNFVQVCSCCGRAIDREFLYCPWCGTEKEAADDGAVLSHVLEQLEEIQMDDRDRRLRDIKAKLNDLEQDLDFLVLHAETLT